MWNCSAQQSLLLPFGDDYVKCESSNPAAGGSGFDKMLPTDYDLQLSFSPSFQTLQAPAVLPALSPGSYYGTGDNSIYSGPAFTQFSYTVPANAANHLVRWTAAGEATAGDGSGFRASKRFKKISTATTQSPQLQPQCTEKPRNQATKAPCKRSQKLGDKITALQQLVSPYGKTDTASVLHEAAACIRSLHEQIQILTAPYPGTSFSASSRDSGEDELVATEPLRRRGLCLAPLSPAVVRLVSDAAHGGRRTDVEEDCWFRAL